MRRADRAVDQSLGTAMRLVPIPDHLRKNLVARLDAERGDWYRHRIGHAVRALAVAAVVLIGVWGIVLWRRPGPTVIDFNSAIEQAIEFRRAPDDKVRESLRILKVDAPAPADLRYMYLAGPPALSEFQGKRVPMLVFVNRDEQRALVYLLSSKDFDLNSVASNLTTAANYDYRIELVPQDKDNDHAYLVLHTGANWDWLRLKPDP